jgi:hypothetical protein
MRAMGDGDPIDAASEALYGAPLSAFTAERKRLADQLKAAGAKPAATAVGKLPRPTMSAWVVNQLWRTERADMELLLATGARVRDGDRAGLDEQRAVMARLRTRAAAVLTCDGHAASPTTIQRVATTLQALSALGTWEPDRPGRLVADRDPPGFEVMLGAVLDAAPAPSPPVPRPPTPPLTVVASASASATTPAAAGSPPTDELAARRAAEERAAAERAAQERAARAARARIRAAERALLERAVEGMRRAVVQRTAELANARAEVEVAEAALTRAHTHVDQASAALAEAERRVQAAESSLAEHDDDDDEAE